MCINTEPSAQDKKKNDIRESPIQGRPDNMPVPKPPEKPKKSVSIKWNIRSDVSLF